MTVAELITWLQAQNQAAQVYIQDADTGWLLPVHTGGDTFLQNKRPDDVFLHGVYDEGLQVV